MKNPHFICRPPTVDDRDVLPATELLPSTGRNTGNLLFISALTRAVKADKLSCKVGFNPRKVAAEHDGLVIPAANWINTTSDWGGLGNLIEAAKLPCVIVGLGAQSSSFQTHPKVTPGSLRFLKIVSERCHSLSVRGQYSAEVLAGLGIKNVTVTGCPSLLWHVDRPAAAAKPARAVRRVAVCSSRETELARLEQKNLRFRVSLLLSREARRLGYDYVAQTEIHDMRWVRGELAGEAREEALAYLKAAYGDDGESTLDAYMRGHVRTFFDVDEWIRYAGSQEFIVGTRLHGVIAGMLAGVPGMLVMHDTRTEEMAVQAGLPRIPGEALTAQGALDAQALYDAADVAAFNRRQVEYYAAFKAFFDANGVETRLRPQPAAPLQSSTAQIRATTS